jgi:hypothetical protein
MNTKNIILLLVLICFCSTNAGSQVYNLDTCKSMAIENNLKMKNAFLETQIATQTKHEAFTKYFPHIEANGITFKTNHQMLQKDFDFSALAPVLPFLANPIHVGFMDKGRTASILATQPVFAGGQIINSNKLAKQVKK